MFKIELLNTFSYVAELGSFTDTAMKLGLTPMAVSKQITLLEKQLSEPLFERTTRKVKLTEFGESFLEQASQILDQNRLMDYWLESRKGKISGVIKVVSQGPQLYQATIFPWLAEFTKAYPLIELELDVKENLIDINKDQYDVYWGIGEYLGEKHSGLKRRSLWSSQYGVYASPEYIEKKGLPLKPKDLKRQQHELISYLHNQPNDILILKPNKNQKTKSGKAETPSFEQLNTPIKTVAGLLDLASRGLGIVNSAADDPELKALLKDKKLVPLLEDYWWLSAEIYLYYQQVKLEQTKVRTFIDFFVGKREMWL